MISETSKEKFVKSKCSEEKVQNIREIYDAVFQNPGNGLAELPIIMKLCLTDLRNENLPSRTSVSDLALSWAVRHLLKCAVQFSRHRDNEIQKI